MLRLRDGRSMLDLYGRGFVLLRFGVARRTARRLRRPPESAACRCGQWPIDEPEAAEIYERKLVLVRPDGHVAWRGDQRAGRCSRHDRSRSRRMSAPPQCWAA